MNPKLLTVMVAAWNNFSTKHNRLFAESIWIASGQIMRAIGMLVGIRFLTSFVTPAVFGKFSLLLGVLALGTGIFIHPFLHAINRFYHEANQSNTIPQLRLEIKKLLIYSVSLMALIIIFAGSFYAYFYTTASILTSLILIALLFAEVFSAYETNFLTASRRQAYYSIWVAIECWLKAGVALLLIKFWQPSVNAILIGYTIGIIFTLFILYLPPINTDNYVGQSLKKKDNSELTHRIFTFAFPLFPLALVGWISSVGDRYIIGAMLDYNAVGFYAAAYGIIFQPFLIAGGIIELVTRPIYFQAVSDREEKCESSTFRYWLVLVIIISIAGFFLVLLSHDFISDIFLGKDFRPASDLMPWIGAGGGLLAVCHVMEKPFYAYMQTRFVLLVQISGSFSSIALCLLLIPFYGISGAAIAVPIYFGLQCLVAFILNLKFAKKSKSNEIL